MDPMVSFVVPCYKLAHMLPECVNSILKQAGVNLSQVDQTEVWDEYSETSLEATFEFSVEDNQADRVSSEFRAIGFVVRSEGSAG